MIQWEIFAEISKLNVGAGIVVKGTLVATPQAKQPFRNSGNGSYCGREHLRRTIRYRKNATVLNI